MQNFSIYSHLSVCIQASSGKFHYDTKNFLLKNHLWTNPAYTRWQIVKCARILATEVPLAVKFCHWYMTSARTRVVWPAHWLPTEWRPQSEANTPWIRSESAWQTVAGTLATESDRRRRGTREGRLRWYRGAVRCWPCVRARTRHARCRADERPMPCCLTEGETRWSLQRRDE